MTRTRGVAAVVVSALAALLALGGALPARAAGPGDIDPAGVGSITVHKHTQAATEGAPATGADDAAQVPEGSEPLAGVTFAARRIADIDLTGSAGWDAADGLAPGAFGYDLAAGTLTTTGADPVVHVLADEAVTATTGPDGVARLDDLPLGAWLVVETAADLPAGSGIVGAAEPFVVTVPRPAGDGSWNWDVTAYPKNSVATITKSVDDADDHVVGDVIDWPVRVGLPWLPAQRTFESLVLTDTLDPALTLAGVSVEGMGETDFTVEVTDNTLTLALTPAGLGKLSPGGELRAVISTTLTEAIGADSDGLVPNTAGVSINGSPVIESEPTRSAWGALVIHKTGAGAPLPGAVFDVVSGGETVAHLTSGGDGATPVLALKAGDYVLVETDAPAGFVRVADIPVSIEAGDLSEPTVVAVDDPAVPGGILAATGAPAAGIVLAGLTLLAAGAGLARRIRARDRR